MKIEIPDKEANAILAGLRSGDQAVVSRIADLLQKEVELWNKYPFLVSLDGEHLGDFSSLEDIRKDFDDELDHDRIEVYDRIRDVYVSNNQIWRD